MGSEDYYIYNDKYTKQVYKHVYYDLLFNKIKQMENLQYNFGS